MKIVIEKGSEGGGVFEITRAPDFSEMSGGAKKFRDDRTTKYLRLKKILGQSDLSSSRSSSRKFESCDLLRIPL